MRVVFVSNFMNHHQIQLCDNLYEKLDKEFRFIATERIPQERLNLGYEDLNSSRAYILCEYEEGKEAARRVCDEADVMIVGSAPDEYIKNFGKGKMIFRYSERPYKNHSRVRAFLSEIRHHYRFLNKNIYILCASAYTAVDHSQFGMYRNRFYKWGYFPQVKQYFADELMAEKPQETVSLLWVGRMLSWKHPEVAVHIAKRLADDGYPFQMNMIGVGEMEVQLKKMASEFHITDKIFFLGSMSPESVRSYMEKSNIFLFTSDRNEGWGAVLNEAMNSGCAAIADAAIGSAPFLIENGKNGFIYTGGSVDQIYHYVKQLMNSQSLRKQIGLAAYQTLAQVWSPETAASRFVELLRCLQSGRETPFHDGPCSRAAVIKEEN